MLSLYHLIMSNGKPYSIWRHDRSVINNGTIPAILSMSTGDWVPLITQQYLTITGTTLKMAFKAYDGLNNVFNFAYYVLEW